MPRRVLLVDDSAVTRTVTSERLARRGLLVTTLSSSREVEQVEPNAFAAALLDLDLGDGFGPDVAARLRRASPQIPIAFLTGGGGCPNVLDAARAIGPVFTKARGSEEAIGWVLAVVGL